MNKLFVIVAVLQSFMAAAQLADTTGMAVDSAEVEGPAFSNVIVNAAQLEVFFSKLDSLKNEPSNPALKLNIVHIGDSHIQADLQTDQTRKLLQGYFGNGGRGFIFPHRLAGTNGSSDIVVSSSAKWNSYRNISPVSNRPVGLGGFSLETSSSDFYAKISVKDQDDYFNRIRVITPDNRNNFNLSLESVVQYTDIIVPKQSVHTIRAGEVLSVIADKYNVTVSALKKANGLRSNLIRAGKKLKIPGSGTETRSVSKSHFVPIELETAVHFRSYVQGSDLQSFYLIPAVAGGCALNGLVLENNRAGLLYHNIGVNGAKLSDYNKTPLFFDQLPALSPDLVVIALGTNESFDHLSGDLYMAQLKTFIANVRSRCGDVRILVVSPPPSLFKRKYPNLFVADYARLILEGSAEEQYAVWDLFAQFGGAYGISSNARNGLIAADRVHYTRTGYEKQGAMFAEVLIAEYENYKRNKK